MGWRYMREITMVSAVDLRLVKVGSDFALKLESWRRGF
jgi:hypothetical protein